MDQQQEQLESIKAIRNMMERSSRFLSLSGFSGAIVGILAIVGVIIAYHFLGMSFDQPGYYNKLVNADGSLNGPVFQFLFCKMNIYEKEYRYQYREILLFYFQKCDHFPLLNGIENATLEFLI